MELRQNARFMVTRIEVLNLPKVTSHLVSKFDEQSVYLGTQGGTLL